jgi:hypothetical protein
VVLWRTAFFEEMERVLLLELVIDEDPGAVFILIDLAFTLILPAARPV